MNHAATSGTKPKEVTDAVIAFLTENNHQNAGRGGDEAAAMRVIFESRTALAELFGAPGPANVVFTSGATESLNIALHGLAGAGSHMLATGLEHNAVVRPIHLLQRQGKTAVTWLNCEPDGSFDPQSIKKAIRPNTGLLVMTHASNVLGNILPVAEAFSEAKRHGLFTVLDAAQTAGHMAVTMDGNTDIIAFTGHKGLRGITGIGGLIINKDVADKMEIWKAGGAGSYSQSPDMPDCLPDRLEPGTLNMPGIISLRAAAAAIKKTGLETIRKHEQTLTSGFIEGLRQLPVIIYGNHEEERRMPVISINIPGTDLGILAGRLIREFGIETRSGLHCAPLAHKTIGTFPHGALRFSFGIDTTIEEIDYTLEALRIITSGAV